MLLPDVDVIAGPPPAERVANVDVLLGIGPWTHVADLADDGALPRRVVLMGGALAPIKHRGELRRIEHNVGADPDVGGAPAAHDRQPDRGPARRHRPAAGHRHDEKVLAESIPGFAEQLDLWRQDIPDETDDDEATMPLVLHDVAALLVALGDRVARMESRRLVDRARRHDVGVGRRTAPARRRAYRRRRDTRPDAHARVGGWLTGLEPATFGTTSRRSNQLSYNHHASLGRSKPRPGDDHSRGRRVGPSERVHLPGASRATFGL